MNLKNLKEEFLQNGSISKDKRACLSTTLNGITKRACYNQQFNMDFPKCDY